MRELPNNGPQDTEAPVIHIQQAGGVYFFFAVLIVRLHPIFLFWHL